MVIRGKVVKGLGVGRKLGYPTANLEIYGGPSSGAPEDSPQDIESGVFAARVTVGGSTHNAAVIIGARTENGRMLIEVHLLDFNEDLYNKEILVDILKRVSDIEQIDNEKELTRKIARDIQLIKQYWSR